MLHQSVSYFDRHPPGSIATSLSTDTYMIDVGLADKVASVCQGCGMIIGAFGIGFAKSWRLTLVISTTLIWMIGVTMVLGTTDSKLQSKQRAIYSQASTIAEEALSSILSITALSKLPYMEICFSLCNVAMHWLSSMESDSCPTEK